MSASSPTERFRRRLVLAAALARQPGRADAARELAADLLAEDLVIFVRDDEVGVLLPIRGLRQTWPRAWRDFVAEAASSGRQTGQLPWGPSPTAVSVRAFSSPDGSAVLVLVGGQPRRDGLETAALLLPILAHGFAHERELEVARAQATVARAAAADARSITAALDASRRALQQEVRTREEFLAAASHDLKNPLGVVKGVAQLVLRRLDQSGSIAPERLRNSLGSIETAVDQMVKQVDELLDVARLQMGQPLELNLGPTDLVALARGVVADYQRGTERHELRVETREERLIGQWDSARLTRVVSNLVGNAVKYSFGGGQIVVSIWRESDARGNWACIQVRDQGIGIPEAEVTRVFERFHRAENVIGRISGAGVGLSASSQLIEQHGGAITVESREGIGSTFTVHLPIRAPSIDQPVAAECRC